MRYISEKEAAHKEMWIERHQQRYRDLYHRCVSIHDLYDDVLAGLCKPDSIVLDLGCGKKGMMQKYAPRVAFAVGADISVDALKQYTALDGYVQADANCLPFPDHSFDCVVSQWLFEHLADPRRVASEMVRVVRPGGALVVVTNSVYNPMMWLSSVLPAGFRDHAKKRVFPGEIDEDTFPTYYRCNSVRAFARVFGGIGCERMLCAYAMDPSLFLFSRRVFALSLFFDLFTNPTVLRCMKPHIIAHYRTPANVDYV